MIFFATKSGSIYVVDTDAKIIRRCAGPGPTTDRLAAGRKYSDISDVVVGHPVMVVWDDDTPLLGDSPEGSLPTTLTSPVVEVFDEGDFGLERSA